MDIETLSLKSFNREILKNQNSSPMCTNTKKFICVTLSLAFISIDVLLNAFYVTDSFRKSLWLSEEHQGKYVFATSLVDLWIISLLRDLFLTMVVFWTIIQHPKAHNFIKFVHKRYIGAFLCLLMYSFAMIKMLFYADQRSDPDKNHMFMSVWNIFAGFIFFIEVYMFALIKPKQSDSYKKTNVDGSDPGESPQEDDILIETLNEANKKRSSLFRLFKYSKSDLHLIAVASFFLLAGAVCEAFVPYYTGQVLDTITVKKNFDTFKKNAILFIAANFASGMFGGIRTCFLSIAVARLNVRFRKLVFRSLIDQDIGFFDKVKTGDMLSRLTSDTTTMSDLISQNLNGFLWNLVKTIGTLAFILKLSWQLSLTCFIGAPIVFSVGKFYGDYYRILSSKVQKCMADSNDVAEQALSTIRTVRSFANEDGEFASYSLRLKDMLKLKIRQALMFTTYEWAVKIAELFMTVSMLSYGAHLVSTNQISSGDFISFVIYQLTLGSCLEGLTSVYTGLMNAAGASEKIFEYLDIKPSLELRNYEPARLEGAIEFKNVSFTYPNRPDALVLKDISFKVKPGEIIALVGPSGSGKSSCIALLERFYRPERGDVLIDNVSISDYNHKYIHRAIALVGQEPVLYAKRIRENIAYGLDEEEWEFEQIQRAARMANAHNFIVQQPLQYDTECGERGAQLSGGQKQRLAIARALIRNPRILLLDEATSALDAESEYLVQQAIHENLKGHTVVIVAHRLTTIEKADKILVLDHGQIVEQGSHGDLLRQNGLYAQLVHKQLHADI
ncbi:ATP-binding cassette sub-family B member 9 isoform X1 [Brachionus plicatilis]|uniref:ATP-binding cassette sub-family B member 9 isoform X1 n=1 Tax=Brachionus plicatilis TaxID=10195 RepID=A0A3M7Q690_BRAPC|nr:ATP-binding cassette sub-family B member 9 isoform X1 [Brachionus plicatilis]